MFVADGADGSDLKDAVCAKLMLGVAPSSVRLLREAEGGGAPVPLDSCETLALQGVGEGSKVTVEVMAVPAADPLPLLTLDTEPAASPGVNYRGAWQLAISTGASSSLRVPLSPPLRSRLLSPRPPPRP